MESNFGYCYVLDFSSSKLYEIELDEKDTGLESVDILDRRGLKEDDCHFMFTENKLDVESINLKDDESI